MALISPKPKAKLSAVKMQINSHLLDEISAYCKWQSIDKEGHFFESAAEYVLKKDKEWLNVRKGE